MTQSPGRVPDRTKKIVTYGVITAAALVLGYIEAQIPYFFTVPGIKLGLANTAAVFALYRLSWGGAAAISAVRVLVFGLLFTSPFSMLFSAAGAAGICAAVSSAAYMAANTVTEIIGDKAAADISDGFMRFEVTNPCDKTLAVLKGLRLHLSELSKEYGSNIVIIGGAD